MASRWQSRLEFGLTCWHFETVVRHHTHDLGTTELNPAGWAGMRQLEGMPQEEAGEP